MSAVPGLPPLGFSLHFPSTSSASAPEPLRFSVLGLPLPPSQRSSTASPLGGFGASLPRCCYPLEVGTPGYPLARWTPDLAVSTVISERGARSQPRPAEALNLLPLLTESSPGLTSFPTALRSSAFRRPRLLQACESVRVWAGELSL